MVSNWLSSFCNQIQLRFLREQAEELSRKIERKRKVLNPSITPYRKSIQKEKRKQFVQHRRK